MILTRKRLLVDIILTCRLSKSLTFCEFVSVNFEPCFMYGHGQKREQFKHTTKNFVEFHNHSRLSTRITAIGDSLRIKTSITPWTSKKHLEL